MNQPTGESSNSSLRETILNAQNLRPFPVSAQQLLQEFRQPEPDIDKLIQLIECDPSVASKILSLANGPLYGMTRPVTSVGHSIVVLGMQSVVQLVTAISTGEMFLGGDKSTEAYRKQIYLRSLASASVYRVIADELFDECGDEAFLVGVMQDVGQLVFLSALDDSYCAQRKALETCPAEWEREKFQIDHAEVGEICARNWGIPQDIHTAIGNHHNKVPKEEHPLSRIATVGQLLTMYWGLGFDEPVELNEEELGVIPAEQLSEMEAEAKDVFAAVSELCGGGA